jgi:uroporphyrinogen-III decarboxylase
MHELIDFLTDWEIECARVQIDHIHPDALFHHDDFGSQTKSFMSPEMFEEFFVPAYKKIYGFWKKNGVQLIVHHSDSYAANLVPGMIEMGVDIFQGAVSENNIRSSSGSMADSSPSMEALITENLTPPTGRLKNTGITC